MPILGTRTLSTPDGILRLFHVTLGGTSFLLLIFSYVHFWALDIFLITVAVCFAASSVDLIINCLFRPSPVRSTPKKVVGSVFHTVAGVCLIIAGIDLIGWSDYDKHCGFKCPRAYYIGIAKILTFINGTLYGIHGFLEAKGSQGDEDLLLESLPLIQVHPPPPPSVIDLQQPYQEEYNNFPSSTNAAFKVDPSGRVSNKMGIN